MNADNKGIKPGLILNKVDFRALPNPHMIAVIEAVINRGYSLKFRAMGMSMHPIIQEGDLITLVPLYMSHFRYGQVVAFTNPFSGALQIHRIWCRWKHQYFIKGDHLLKPDGWIPHNYVLGRVDRVERDGQQADFSLGLLRAIFLWLIALLRPIRFFYLKQRGE